MRAIHLQLAREEHEREELLREEQLRLMRFGSRCVSPVCVCMCVCVCVRVCRFVCVWSERVSDNLHTLPEQRQLMRSHSASGDASNNCNGCHGTKRPLTAQAKLGIMPFDAGSVLLRLPSDASGLSRDRHASGADTARSIQSTVRESLSL